jgi:hypothetical protein
MARGTAVETEHRRRRWTRGDKLALAKLAAARMSDETIARRLGRSSEAVRIQRHKQGVRNGTQDGRGRGPRKEWTTFEEARLRAMAEQGVSTPEIAAALKRSKQSIRCRRSELGLPPPKGRRTMLAEYPTRTLVDELRRRGLDVLVSRKEAAS